MKNLKQQLYQCISQNPNSFELINDFAMDGYCFWEVEKGDKLLLDKKLAHKLELSNTDVINRSQLDDRRREYLNSIISQLELNISSNSAQKGDFRDNIRATSGKINYSLFYF